MIERSARGVFWKTKATCCISLRVAINDECALFFGSERGRKIDCCCSLTDAAFLIGDGDNAPQESLLGEREKTYQKKGNDARCFTWNRNVAHRGST